jgi:hypothetical protein
MSSIGPTDLRIDRGDAMIGWAEQNSSKIV